MSRKDRHAELRSRGWELHSLLEVGDCVIAEFWIKDGTVCTWTPQHDAFELSGSEWKDSVVRNAEKGVLKEIGACRQSELKVRLGARYAWWPDLIAKGKAYRCTWSHYDVLELGYYGRPRAAVRREILTHHYDEAMDHVERILGADEHPERLHVIAEMPDYVFFGERGFNDRLEKEHGWMWIQKPCMP